MKRKLYSLFILVALLLLFITGLKAQTTVTDYFRSAGSGNWNSPSTWVSSPTINGTYTPATIAPDYISTGITISAGDNVTLSDTRIIDQVTVNGTLTVKPNIYVGLNDGPGDDLTITSIGKMILLSDSTGSAGIDNLYNSNTSANATIVSASNVTQQRYFNALRSWRLITAPLKSSTSNVSIYQSWENSGQYVPGVGTFVTAPVGTATEGIDANHAYSIQSFNPSNQRSLTGVSNTMTTPLFTTDATAANKSYFVFVRGDRNPSNLIVPNKNTTTLSATGNLQTGEQAFYTGGNANDIALVGNPYAALVDFSKVTKNNLYDRFYAFDPTLGETGAYVLVDRPAGQTLYNVSVPSSVVTSVLQINQAVFVQMISEGQASLTFEETAKTRIGNSNSLFRTELSKQPSFASNLYGVYSDNSTKLFDGNSVFFDNSYSVKVDRKEDADKLSNFSENLGLSRDGTTLTVEKRPLIKTTDTLYLKLWNTKVRNYQFQFNATNFSSDVTASLEDAYLKTSTPLSLNEPALVSFSITADAASADANRFTVVFKKAPSIVDITSGKAGINIYPNPVQGKMLNLQLYNLPEGKYSVQLFNSLGQQVFSKTIQHPGGSFTQTLGLSRNVAKGSYQVQVTDGQNKIHKQVICN